MTRDEILAKYVNAKGRISSWASKSVDVPVMVNLTNFLPPDASIKERMICLRDGISTPPKCERDGCLNKPKILHSTYARFCGKKCSGLSEKTKDKKKETNIDRYGVEFVSQNTKVRSKVERSCQDRYGVLYVSQIPDIRKRIANTWNLKYGSAYVETDDFKDKRRSSLIAKFGVDSPLKDPAICQKMIDTHLDKYGRVGGEAGKESKAERDICDFLNSNGGNFVKNSEVLNGRELDMYDETEKLAIEYNGLYWHSDRFIDKQKHFEKWKECRSLGITLITIFEDEWKTREKQVKQFLKAKLGRFDTRIAARSTHFEKIDDIGFINENHIQTNVKSVDAQFGLVYDGQIVASVSYKQHHRKSNQMTLNRLVFRDGWQIIGGVGKLLRNSLPLVSNDIITWSDNRWSDGEIYRKNLFEFDGNVPVDYSYVVNHKTRVSKQSMTKKKIGCPANLTESEYCKSLGFYRIWDCGKQRWRFKI